MKREQSAVEKKRSLGVALIQLRPGTEDVAQNCDHMASKVKQAIAEAEQPVHVVVLPVSQCEDVDHDADAQEMWSCLVVRFVARGLETSSNCRLPKEQGKPQSPSQCRVPREARGPTCPTSALGYQTLLRELVFGS